MRNINKRLEPRKSRREQKFGEAQKVLGPKEWFTVYASLVNSNT